MEMLTNKAHKAAAYYYIFQLLETSSFRRNMLTDWEIMKKNSEA
jgi:hypothetical protein